MEASGVFGSPGDAFLLLLPLTDFLCRPFAFQLLGLPLIHPGGVLTVFIQQGFLVALAVRLHLPVCNARAGIYKTSRFSGGGR